MLVYVSVNRESARRLLDHRVAGKPQVKLLSLIKARSCAIRVEGTKDEVAGRKTSREEGVIGDQTRSRSDDSRVMPSIAGVSDVRSRGYLSTAENAYNLMQASARYQHAWPASIKFSYVEA